MTDNLLNVADAVTVTDPLAFVPAQVAVDNSRHQRRYSACDVVNVSEKVRVQYSLLEKDARQLCLPSSSSH